VKKFVSTPRLVISVILICIITIIYVLTLYYLQIVKGEEYYEQSRNSIVTTQTVTAARGSILDRYGRVLVTNRNCNNIIINVQEMFYADGMDDAKSNEAILKLANTVLEYGDTYTDELPITMESPFEYTDISDEQRVRLNAWLNENGLDEDASAIEVMAKMRTRYRIDNSYTSEETRRIAGIRYEINVRYLIHTSDYIFAEDVSMELITTLMESGVPGFEIQSSYVRDYNTEYAAHILGYIGKMDGVETEKYVKQGYSYNALVGKDGAEHAFEDELHGIDGEARITSTSSGVVTSTVYTKQPEPGNHVYLTIDIRLQEAAENALNRFIVPENEKREQANFQIETYGGAEDDKKQLITGAAAVAVEVKTGEPLAIASWPTYDVSTLLENFTEISQSENKPLFNRALMGAYAPGSTFKPVTAISALDLGKIATTTVIECLGIFTKYAKAEDGGYAPKCWIYGSGTHGAISVTEAITVSCNYFFYEVGDMMNIDQLDVYAKLFGLGESTGIELAEETGNMSSKETHMELFGVDWYLGDMLQASIGQSDSVFTPLQMAEYCATLANGGTRHSAAILKSVRSFDYSQTVFQPEEEVLSQIDTDPKYFEAVQLGMYGVANDWSNTEVSAVFAGCDYSVAAKTGTAQLGEKKTNNAVFICYAPYEDPEIAVAVVIEKGSTGSSVAQVAKEILDYYFEFRSSSVAMESEGSLLR